MKKWLGTKIGEWQIVDSSDVEEGYEYAEMTLDELFSLAGYTKENKKSFVNKYFSVNIHQLLCLEKYEECRKVIRAMKTDERLSACNAVVLMTLKPKGAKNILTPLNDLNKFQTLFKEAI